MYSDSKIGKSLIRRVISESKASEELTWHRDRADRVVIVVEGAGWKFQRDDAVPQPINRGDILRVAANEWHRVIPGKGDLVVAIHEGEKKPEKLIIDLVKELTDESEVLDLDGTEDVVDFQDADLTDEEKTMLVSEDDLLEVLVRLREGKKKINPNYLTKDKGEMRDEIRKHAKKRDDDASAYTSYPKGGWQADYDEKGRPYKTKPSKSTEKFKQRFGESDELEDLDEAALLEGLGPQVRKALKNKAEKANAPLGALTTVYRKGLAAWKTGHRPGANQQQWAMARVNSFLVGGKARKVDAAQWEKVRQFRKKGKKD
jgi:mannose-6-phosphate isomerase-like protein (cupin superfamily)